VSRYLATASRRPGQSWRPVLRNQALAFRSDQDSEILIDPKVFLESVGHNFLLVSGIIAALGVGKWLAAEIAGRAFAYSAIARQTMWSLSLPQVAATLAAAIVAFNTVSPAGARLIDRPMLDTVLVLMVTTSILGPVLTQYFAPGLLQMQAVQLATPPVAKC
jgi:Kef-type K+ transport system membrane component KefB